MTSTTDDGMTGVAFDDPVAPAADDAAAAAESVAFLRRFASMISVGQNAAKLGHAARLIETLIGRTAEAERSARDQAAVSATYADMCRAYEVVIDRQRSEVAALEARLVRVGDEAAAERGRLGTELERLAALLTRARAERSAAADALADLTARFASLGESSVIVSVAALQAVQAQFDSLADEFARHGDVVALAMSDAGRCTVDQLLSARSKADEPSPVAIG